MARRLLLVYLIVAFRTPARLRCRLRPPRPLRRASGAPAGQRPRRERGARAHRGGGAGAV